jgi:hypothetical protein
MYSIYPPPPQRKTNASLDVSMRKGRTGRGDNENKGRKMRDGENMESKWAK